MKRSLAIIITFLASVLVYLYWGEAACYGWIVAVTGWLDKCFVTE